MVLMGSRLSAIPNRIHAPVRRNYPFRYALIAGVTSSSLGP